MKQYDAGIRGETCAEKYLLNQGMTVLARRYRGGNGEIDLIVQDKDTIVFVEVKSRPTSRAGMGLCAVTSAKQRRMTHAAMAFLMDQEYMDLSVRFDVVEITRDGLLHIPNAFMAVREYE